MTARLVRTRARTAAILLGVGAVLAAAVAIAPVASAQEPGNPGLAAFYGQKADWAPCKADPSEPQPPPGMPGIPWEKLDCATLTVPLDYRHPAAGKLSIAVSRFKATDAAKRRGVLLLNPGGPGGDGLLMPLFLSESALVSGYDLIGFDPRGVGRSTRLECEVVKGTDTFITRPTDAQLRTIADEARKREQGCEKAAGGIRPFINTANTARDMDVIRAALGEKKINYLGFSYGTYLGAAYGSLFPAQLDRSVLDSSMHPDWLWYEQAKQVSVAAKQNYDAWVPWIAARNKTYGLGASVAEVNATIDDLGAKLAADPLELPKPVPAGWPLKMDRNFLDLFLGDTRYRDGWDFFGFIIGQLRDMVNQRPTPALSADAGKALTLLAKYSIAETTNGVFQTVTCEADWPRELDTYYTQMRRFRTQYPYGPGAMQAAPTECTFRSFTPPEKPVSLRRKGYPTGIVVQAEYDGNTQYDGGPAMASRLADNLISVLDEGAHGQYGRNDCVTQKVDDYLLNGVLPSSRSECAGTPRPDVPPDDAAAPQKRLTRGSLESQARALIAAHKLDRPF